MRLKKNQYDKLDLIIDELIPHSIEIDVMDRTVVIDVDHAAAKDRLKGRGFIEEL
jgi:broad-specificity NMP kinase